MYTGLAVSERPAAENNNREDAMSMQEDLQLAGRIAHVKSLGSLAENVQPAHTALLIIDM